jgi:hypothetical protein
MLSFYPNFAKLVVKDARFSGRGNAQSRIKFWGDEPVQKWIFTSQYEFYYVGSPQVWQKPSMPCASLPNLAGRLVQE